jgi:hypothetical protein
MAPGSRLNFRFAEKPCSRSLAARQFRYNKISLAEVAHPPHSVAGTEPGAKESHVQFL